MTFKHSLFIQKYLDTDPTDRTPSNTLVFTVKQGEEPSSFTCVFPAFNTEVNH